MPLVFSADDLDVMASVRKAVEPSGSFNPGKILPREGRVARDAPTDGDAASRQRATWGLKPDPADPRAAFTVACAWRTARRTLCNEAESPRGRCI